MKLNSSSKGLRTKKFLKCFLYGIAFFFLLVYLIFFLTPLFGINIFTVATNSMKPVFSEGEMLLVKEVKAVKVGDIITFTNPTFGTITHRLVAIVEDDKQIYYLCCGDNNINEPWQELALKLKEMSIEECFAQVDNVILKENIIGVVKYKLKYIDKIIKFLENNKLFIIILVLLIIYFLNYENKINKQININKYFFNDLNKK